MQTATPPGTQKKRQRVFVHASQESQNEGALQEVRAACRHPQPLDTLEIIKCVVFPFRPQLSVVVVRGSQEAPETPSTKGPLELPSFISLSSSPEEADAPDTPRGYCASVKGRQRFNSTGIEDVLVSRCGHKISLYEMKNASVYPLISNHPQFTENRK